MPSHLRLLVRVLGTDRGGVMDDDDRQLADFCASAYPQLVGALAHHTGDLLLAEELAQEALLRVCRKWSHVRSLASRGMGLPGGRESCRVGLSPSQCRTAGESACVDVGSSIGRARDI